MLPRLRAQETLAGINRAAVAAGAGDPMDRERFFAEQERKAAGVPPPQPVKADPDDLAAMGIGIRSADGEAVTIPDLNAWLGNEEPDHG